MADFREPYLDVIFEPEGVEWNTKPLTGKLAAREIELESNSLLVMSVLEYAQEDPKERLRHLGTDALAAGLGRLFDPVHCLDSRCLADKRIPLERRTRLVPLIGDIILSAWENHASHSLGHTETGYNSVSDDTAYADYLVYMFWDVAWLPHGCERPIIDACIDVMGRCAKSSNPAVVEGALHGLGHMQSYEKGSKRVLHIEGRRRFSGDIGEKLDAYAEAAKTGMIQ